MKKMPSFRAKPEESMMPSMSKKDHSMMMKVEKEVKKSKKRKAGKKRK